MAGSAVPLKVEHRSRGVVRIECALTCDASGDVTPAVVGVGFGKIARVLYDGGLDASAVITVSDAKTGATLFTYTTGTEGTPTAFRPTTNVVDTAGAAISAADTAPNVMRSIKVGGKIKVGVASGGTSETAKLVLVIDESNLGDIALTV